MLPTSDAELPHVHQVEELGDKGLQPMRHLVAGGIRRALDELDPFLSSTGRVHKHEDLDSVVDSEISDLDRESTTNSGLDSEGVASMPMKPLGHRSTPALLPQVVAWDLVRLPLLMNPSSAERCKTTNTHVECSSKMSTSALYGHAWQPTSHKYGAKHAPCLGDANRHNPLQCCIFLIL